MEEGTRRSLGGRKKVIIIYNIHYILVSLKWESEIKRRPLNQTQGQTFPAASRPTKE